MVCTKRSFINKHEAKLMLQSAKGSASGARRECRSYKCDKCRCYHLTSQPLEDYLAEKEQEAFINMNTDGNQPFFENEN